jgi:hypothetical protein
MRQQHGQRMTALVEAAVFADARVQSGAIDPTETAGLRRSFRAAGKTRLQMLRSQLRQAVMEHDLLGLGGGSGGLRFQPMETRLQAFQGWFDAAAGQTLGGPWLSHWISKAWASGAITGARTVKGAIPEDGSAGLLELAKIELAGISGALRQALGRVAALSIANGKAKRIRVWWRLSRQFEKIGPPRIMALANTIAVAAHNTGRAHAFLAAGINQVGIQAERLSGSTLRSDGWTADARKRGRAGLQEEFEESEVGILTAGDDRVCDECDEFAAGSPYDIDEALDALPMHANCRCAIFPWYDRRYKGGDAGDGFDPNEPRDPQGRWTTGGGGEAEVQRDPPSRKQKEMFPGQFPPLPEQKIKIKGYEDFEKAGIAVVGLGRTFTSENAKKFVERWEGNIKVAPEEFKKEFLGSVKASMDLNYDADDDMLTVGGNVLDDKDRPIGRYERVIDFANNKAESAYFKINKTDAEGNKIQGHGIGKEVLARNVEFYQKIGLDQVDVHANIDVGGYAWAKYGYVPSQRSWDQLRDELREKAGGGRSEPENYLPESWDELSVYEQEEAARQWRENTYDDFEAQVNEEWQESGQALARSKELLAKDLSDRDWAYEAVKQWHENRPDVKLSVHDIAQGLAVDYEDIYGDGRGDPKIAINHQAYQALSAEHISEIETRLREAFNARADEQAPFTGMENLELRIRDAQDEHWDGMRDRDRYGYASRYGVIEERESEDDDSGSNIDPDIAEILDDDDPKAIWALSDTPAGKELLLGSDWYGTLDFGDSETMTRFHAYVGREAKPRADSILADALVELFDMLRRNGTEFFYEDEQGNKQDADLHNPILEQGDHAAALAVSRAVLARIRARRAQRNKDAGFDPSEERDPAGRWTAGGGAGSEGSATGVESFISPNIKNLTFKQAQKGFTSKRHQEVVKLSKEIDAALGIQSYHAPVVGAWADGAENSVMVHTSGADLVLERAALAMKGHIADQKQCLLFKHDPNGAHAMIEFQMSGQLADIHNKLLKDGIAFHTLEPKGDGAVVHVFADNHAAVEHVMKTAESYGVETISTKGTGEFIGTRKEDGTDREQRDDARREYERIIRQAGAGGSHPDIEKVWNDYRNRRLSGSTPAKAKVVTPVVTPPASHPDMVASRNVTSKKFPGVGYKRPDVAAMQLDPKKFAETVSLFGNADAYPNFRPGELTGTPAEQVRTIIDHMKANIRFMYDNASATMLKSGRTWYEKANGIAGEDAAKYGISKRAAAGVIATLSPQKDWNQNIYMAHAVMEINHSQRDHKWDDEMEKTAARIWKPKDLELVNEVRGKKLGELTKPAQKATWIRTYDEAHSDRSYTDFDTGEQVLTAKGVPARVAWQSVPAIANAVTCMDSGGIDAISESLGVRHKVRSFYNNIIAPHAPEGDVTIDTHAVGVALLRPLSGKQTGVMHALATSPKGEKPPGWKAAGASAVTGLSGTYAIYADAYREVADELGLLPQQLQAITWQEKREMLGMGPIKRGLVESEWVKYRDSVQSLAETQQAILTIARDTGIEEDVGEDEDEGEDEGEDDDE